VSIIVAALAIGAEVGLSAGAGAPVTPKRASSRSAARGLASESPRGGSRPPHEIAQYVAGRRRCSRSAWPPADPTTKLLVIGPRPADPPPATAAADTGPDHQEPGQRVRVAEDRLEELHRAEDPSARSTPRAWRPPGLHDDHGSEPRRRADGAEGAQGRPESDAYPEYTGHGAAVVLQDACGQSCRRTRRPPTSRPRRTSRRRA